MKIRTLFRQLLTILGLTTLIGHAHNLDTRATSIAFARDFIDVMVQRSTTSQPLVQVGDEFWMQLKTTPGPGTTTGVGGYQTFYVPAGFELKDVAYVLPDDSDPRGFREIPMKGQSPIAIGNGSISSKTTPELIGWELPGVNGLGVKTDPVTAAGADRGTLAGVYADTGIFFSTDARTTHNSYGATASGGTPPMQNNSGDTVGEFWAANVTNSSIIGTFGTMTLWDSYQLRAYGRRDVTPIIDSGDGRGNAPWGLASAVAGPQSGYAWEFDFETYNATSGSGADKMRAAINIGPWNRIQYPGSQISSDQPGLISNVLGNAGIDASQIGTERSALPPGITAVRFALGQLELGRPEISAVKVRIASLDQGAADCFPMYADAFGGDAGGTDGGKDHLWRYFDPTVVKLDACTILQKTASRNLVAPGDTYYYDLVFINNGVTILPDVTLTDALPTGLQFLSATSAPSSVSGQNYTWNLGAVMPQQVVTIRYFVKAIGSGTLYNTVTARSGPNVIATASQSVEVGTRAIIVKSKSVTPSNVAPGGTVQYTMVIENIGTGPSGTPMVVRDTLPPGFYYSGFVDATLNGAVINNPTISINASNTSQPVFTISQGIQRDKSLVIRFNALVGPGVQPGTYFNEFDVQYEGKRIPPIPEAPVTVGGGQIGDTVWRDWNGDGVQDAGEEGIPGVIVNLYQADGTTLIASKTTNASGNYLFTGLDAGTYVVKIGSGIPSGYLLTGDPDSTPDGEHSITLADSEAYLTADFGYQPAGTASIGDTVFSDLNGNGSQNPGEPGIPDITVRLYEDSNGNGVIDAGDLQIAQATTDSNGNYNFPGLAVGLSYIVQVDAADSDLASFFDPNSFNNTTPINHPVVNLAGAYTDADFGFIANLPSSIGDTVFLDLNGNGTYDIGTDNPIGDVLVTLYRDANADGIPDGPAIATRTTDSAGYYIFGGLAPDTYLVVVDSTSPSIPAGATASVSQFIVLLPASTQYLTADFPFVRIISKTVDKAVVNPAGTTAERTVTYTIVPNFPGSEPLSGVLVSDPIPTGTSYVANSINPAGDIGSFINDVADPPVRVEWDLGSNAPRNDGLFFVDVSNAVTLYPSQDTYANQEAATTNYASATTFQAGAQKNRVRNAFLQFDLSSIPSGSVISSATLNLNKTAGPNKNATVGAHAITSAWTDTAVTWNAQPTFEATASASITLAKNSNGLKTWNVGPLVQRWVDGSLANNGLAIKAANQNAHTFSSVEAAGTNNDPTLVVNYLSAGSRGTRVSLAAGPSLVGGAGPHTLTVTMTATVAENTASGTLTPPANLTIGNTSGATVTKASGPTPASATVPASGGTVTFTYTYTVSSPTTAGEITFSGKPTSNGTGYAGNGFPSTAQFNNGTSNSVLATRPLVFQVLVTNSNPPAVVENTAELEYNNQSVFTPTVQTATTASIGDYVWVDLNGDGVQDSGEFGIAGVKVYLDSNSNGQWDSGEPYDITDSAGLYRIFGLAAGNYTVRYDFSTIPTGYLPTTAVSLPVTLASAQQYTLADFGLRPAGTGSIGDFVWLDANNDGVQDPDESPLPGIGLSLERLVAGDWVTVATTTTAADGSYHFDGLLAGDYRVTVDTTSQVTSPYASGTFALGSAMAPTFDDDGIATPHVTLVTLASDSTQITTTDFGYNWSGRIGDYVWWDDNLNGLQDEPASRGIFDARVQLFFDADGDGVLSLLDGDYEITRVFTDANGYYLIENLPPGRYFVDVYEDSVATPGVRDVVPTTANLVAINLGAGQQFLDADFGYYQGARVEGIVFWDVNHNGILEGGEGRLETITVTLTGTDAGGNPISRTTQTDANGFFVFLVPEGDYTVTYSTPDVLANYPLLGTPTTVQSFTFNLEPGEDGVRVFYFGVDNTGMIGDTIFADNDGNGTQGPGEPGFANITVNLYLDLNGDGTIDFGAGDLLLETTLTDASGKYEFIGLDDTAGPARYLVEVLTSGLPPSHQTVPTSYPSGADIVTSRYSTALTNGESITIVDFGYPLVPDDYYAISGTIYHDNGAGGGTSSDGSQNGSEPGIANVRVVVDVDTDGNGSDDQSYVIFTDASGFYSLGGIIKNANVRVTVDSSTLPSGAFVQTGDPDGNPLSEVWTITTITTDQNNLDFGYLETLGSIAGTVVKGNGNGSADSGEPEIENVTVTLRFAGPDGILGTADDVISTTTTASNGTYSFTGLLPGPYEITTSIPTGYHQFADADGFNPNSINVNLPLGSNVTGRDFEYQSASLTGTLWNDSNGNAVRDSGEPLLNGVTVFLDLDGNGTLDSGEPTTTTDSNGFYEFLEINSGSYQVRVDTTTLPAGLLPIFDIDGIATPHVALVIVNPNQNITDVDYGYYAPVSISGTVRADTNGDGNGDSLLDGVVLSLLDGTGSAVLDGSGNAITATTDSSGNYSFSGLLPGTYQVRETQPSGYGSISDVDGDDPDWIGNITPITLVSGQNSTGKDFLEFLQACPDRWTAWQDKWDTTLGGLTGPAENPDGDRYSNLLEYAFCMPPHSGIRKPFCLFSSESVNGGVDGIYSRTAGGAKDVVYQLELASTLGSPTSWTSVILDGTNTTVTNNGDGSERVRVSNLESFFAPGTTRGFVRIRIILDDGITQATDTTETLGWTKTLMDACCTTYNNPFLQCALFTGTVDSVDGQDLVVTNSAGPFSLAAAITDTTGLYIEVTSGENTGRRYDVASLGSDRITLTNDGLLFAADPPFNTHLGAPATDLAGDTIVLRRHHTLDYLFAPLALVATNSQSTADQVQIFAGGGWTIYWLYDENDADPATARWVTAANAGMADMGGNVIPPGQGVFFNNRHDPVTLLAFGEVRENPFVRPMSSMSNLVGGGYPIDQSLNGNGGRAMNPGTGFFGSTDFKTADSTFIWRADSDTNGQGYHSYYLANGAPTFPTLLRWVIVGDKNLVERDAEILLPGNRSAFIRAKDPIPEYTCPAPWNP